MKSILRLTSICLLILLSSCEKDVQDDSTTSPNLNEKIKTINFEALKSKLPEAKNTIQKLERNRANYTLSKLEDEYTFDLDSIKEFNGGEDYQSYTIKAQKINPAETEYIYKLLIENKNDTIRSSIISFDFKDDKLLPVKQEEFALENNFARMECYQIVIINHVNVMIMVVFHVHIQQRQFYLQPAQVVEVALLALLLVVLQAT